VSRPEDGVNDLGRSHDPNRSGDPDRPDDPGQRGDPGDPGQSGESNEPGEPGEPGGVGERGTVDPAAGGSCSPETREHPLPRWVGLLFLAVCLGIIPQIVSLSSTLAHVQLANNWRTTWVGLDIAESLIFLLTAWFLFRQSRLVSITASIAFALLWLDAWFDVMTSISATDVAVSRTLAVFVELPLGVFCLLVALRPLHVVRRPEWLSRAARRLDPRRHRRDERG
jgi:hypothetical protein